VKAFAGKIIFGCIVLPLAAIAQPTAPAKVNALPTPTPPQKRGDRPPAGSASAPLNAATSPASSAPIFNAPQHSPDQLDFGSIPDGASTKKTFSLTTNASGYVTVAIPAGPFHLVEFREIGPAQGGSKNPGGQSPAVALGGIRSRIKYQENQTGPFQWSMAPNTEMQIDIVFAPKIQGGTAGPKIANMSVTGPGPRGNWALTIPLRGSLSNLKVSPEPPQPKSSFNELQNLQEFEPLQPEHRLNSQGQPAAPQSQESPK